MKKLQILTSIAVVWLLVASFGAQHVGAQFDISWYTIDGGGGYSAGGNFEVEGTIGQPDAGVVMTGGGGFQLAGGFWAAGTAPGGQIQTAADSINIFRGLLVSGVLSDTFDSDDSRMKFNPGLVLNSTEAPVWLIFDGILPSDSPASLSIVMEAQAGTPGLTGTLEAWNWQTNSYKEIDVTGTSFNSDSVVAVDVSADINNFVQSSSGAVRTRVGWRKTGLTINFPWEIRLDQIVWLSQ